MYRTHNILVDEIVHDIFPTFDRCHEFIVQIGSDSDKYYEYQNCNIKKQVFRYDPFWGVKLRSSKI